MTIPSNTKPGNVLPNQDSKFLSPTLKLDDASLDVLQFQQDQNSSSSQSSRGVLSQRFLHPVSIDAVNEVNYKIHVPNFANLPPLKLGYKYITDLIKIDSMTPSDLYSDENINRTGSGLDNYYFDYDSRSSANFLGSKSLISLIYQTNFLMNITRPNVLLKWDYFQRLKDHGLLSIIN